MVVVNLEKKRSLHGLIQAFKEQGLLFDKSSNTGVILHMANSYEPTGKIGAVFIGANDKEIEGLQERSAKTMG